MAGQKNGAASSRARARVGGRPARRIRLPDKIAVACPPGTRQRIEAAAEHDGMTPADWLRRVLRLALEAARKRQARGGPWGV